MKAFLLIALALFSGEALAFKRLVNEHPSYAQVFGQGSTQSVAYSGTQGSVVVQSSYGEATEYVRILATTSVYLEIGATSSIAATTADMPIPADTEVFFELQHGHSITAVQRGSPGFLYVTHLKTFPQ